MSQPTYIVTIDQPTTVVVSPDQVVASVPASVQGPAGPAPAGTGLVQVTNGVASTLTHPSPSPAGTHTLATVTADAFGRVTAASSGTVSAATISDSTTVGRSVLTAADAVAARAAIGAGTGNATTAGTLAQFAATTSAELRGVLSDETGSGAAVFAGSPAFTGTATFAALTASGTVRGDRFQAVSGNSAFIPGPSAFLDYDGSDVRYRNTSSAFVTTHWFTGTGGLFTASAGVFGWSNTTNAASGTVYIGLARLDDNTVEINNGTRTASGGAPRGLSVSSLTASGLVSVGTYTVATLPSASANAGRLAQVTDSSVTANGSAVAGGGANRVLVYSNGTTWDVVVA